MIRKNILSAAAAMLLSGSAAFAQDIHFTQFDAAPLTVNPAFTGAFYGNFRVSGIYRNQWRSVTVPFQTYCVSVDAPLAYDLSGTDDYLAGGLQLYNDKAGDANLSNTSVLGSVAYHKGLGGEGKVLTVGFQGGYTSKSMDISKLYFGDEFINGGFQKGFSAEYPFLNHNVHYWTINAGVAWAQSTGDNFAYTIGLGANNLNQPRESFQQKENSEVGLGLRYTGQIGAIARVSSRLILKPGFLYQSQSSANEIVVGNEFLYGIGADPTYYNVSTNVFAGAYYRTSDAFMITAGVEYRGVRFGVSYDYNTSSLKDASNGNGGYEFSIRFVNPFSTEFARKLAYPCSRF